MDKNIKKSGVAPSRGIGVEKECGCWEYRPLGSKQRGLSDYEYQCSWHSAKGLEVLAALERMGALVRKP